MSIQLSINTHKMEADLRHLLGKVQGPGRALILKAGGHAVASISTRAFRDESLRPAPWLPVKPATQKRKKKGRTSTLIDEVKLFRSIRANNPAGETVEIVSDRFYASFHQFGTKKMPARPFVPATGGAGGGEANLTAEAEKRVRRAMEAQTKAVLGGE